MLPPIATQPAQQKNQLRVLKWPHRVVLSTLANIVQLLTAHNPLLLFNSSSSPQTPALPPVQTN